ncbi:hypothetical protein ATY75_12235 [Rhizobium sp. N122]|uniref:hypothetical protein n=1 Tax=Rhizobium sp. N122 TaxID=1764272 RepID=UPI000B5A5056|nr:hypothetical protein [Rhizobium sp. N122]OWV62585.1 hypothetical protein ATY75_12235 [Rhizobium sp. N122]
MTTPIVPNSNQPLVDNRGFVTPVWQRFFGALLGAPAAISPVTVSASPTSFTAYQRGTVGISAGTLTSVSLTRAGTTVTLGTTRSVTVANGDVVTVSYTVAPTINFIPL